jgi:tartrate dehydratase beta subunit/fumarate hydratase class I family protein
MGLYIDTFTPTKKDAVKFANGHAIIAKKDLRRIRALAKKLGFLEELKALKVEMLPPQRTVRR